MWGRRGGVRSVQRAVLSLCVGVCVRAGGVLHDDGSSLLLLGARSPLPSAFDVLDGLRGGQSKDTPKQTVSPPRGDGGGVGGGE